MTDNNLKHLSRLELLEILVEQGKQLEALNAENARLFEENVSLRAELSNRKIMLEEAGSIAKAALELNGVFEAAQKAADTYLENIRRLEREKVNAAFREETTPAAVAVPVESLPAERPSRKLTDLLRMGHSATESTKTHTKKVR